MHDGAALKILQAEINTTIEQASKHTELSDYCDQLSESLQLIEHTIMAVSKSPDPALALANATLFLDAMGHVVVAWCWLKQAVAALQGQATASANDVDFYAGKLAACHFFYRYELPKIVPNLELVASLDSTCFDLKQSNLLVFNLMGLSDNELHYYKLATNFHFLPKRRAHSHNVNDYPTN